MKPIFFLLGILMSLTNGASAKESKMAAQNNRQGPPIHHVVFHKPGPAWEKGVSFKQQKGVQGHVTHYAKVLEEGKLYAGGPFLDDGGGGMMITTEGVSEEWISKFAAEDPTVKSGLITFEIRPWLIGMEREK